MKHDKCLGMNSILRFGKYKDQTVEDVVVNDPEYMAWVSDNVEYATLEPEVISAINHELNRYGR